MGLVINHNMMAANAARNLTTVYNRLATSTQRLSSGLRINSAADDAAGLAIRELMRADIAVLNQGIRNASDAVSMIQTAEGALSVIDEKLTRMKELAEQAATGTYTTAQREIMDSEYQAMAAEIDRIANATDFNGIKLLDGSMTALHDGSGLKVHFGTGNESAEDYYYMKIEDSRATVESGLQVGGGKNSDVWTSETAFESKASAVTTTPNEYMTFWYNASADSDMTGIDSNPSYLVGIYNAASGDTLEELVDTINQGTAARVQMSFYSSAGGFIAASGAAAAQCFQVGNTTVGFYSASAHHWSLTPDVGIDTTDINGDVASRVCSAINAYDDSDVFAVRVDAETVLFFAKEAGTDGNSLTFAELDSAGSTTTDSNDFYFTNLSTGTSAGTEAEGSFSLGGQNWVNASIYEDTEGYKLRLTGAGRGTGFDINILDIDDVLASATSWSDPLDNFSSASGDFDETMNASGVTWDGAEIVTQSQAQLALLQLDAAILQKDKVRASLGALQNRLENTVTNLSIQAENLQASESRISDVDVALEMTEFTRNNIMSQAATAMLAQANSIANLALSLLR